MREPKPVQTDADGTKWWRWVYEYDWDGSKFAFDIVARTREEADARIRRLPLARYVGQADGDPVPAKSRGALIVPLIVWWRNLFA